MILLNSRIGKRRGDVFVLVGTYLFLIFGLLIIF